jgi:hypothetical protein
VLRLAVRRVLVPPILLTTNLKAEGLGVNNAVFSEPSMDARRGVIERLPLAQQPAAWNALDKVIQTTYSPTS